MSTYPTPGQQTSAGTRSGYRKPAPGRSLAERFPGVCLDWDHEANGSLRPEDLHPSAHVKVYWRCAGCGGRDHQDPATRIGKANEDKPLNVTADATGFCTRCRRTAGKDRVEKPRRERLHVIADGGTLELPTFPKRLEGGRTLAQAHPEIAAQWHPSANGTHTPDDVSRTSQAKPWWVCPAGHPAYRAMVSHRTYNKSGCPLCGRNRMGDKASGTDVASMPDLAPWWDMEKNEVDPASVWVSDKTPRWWKCSRCGSATHKGASTIYYGLGIVLCHDCSDRQAHDKRSIPEPGRSLAELFPGNALDWDTERNGDVTPAMVAPSSKRFAFWCCSACGSRTHQMIASRTGTGRKAADRPTEIATSPAGVKCPRCRRIGGVDLVDPSLL